MSTPPLSPNEFTYRDPTLSLWQSAVFQFRHKAHTSAMARQLTAAVQVAPPTLTSVLADPLMAPAHDLGAALSNDDPLPASVTAQPAVAAAHTVGVVGVVIDCAAAAAKFLWAEIRGNQQDSDTYANQLKYAPCDALGWAECLSTYLLFKASCANPIYRPNQNVILPIPNQATIAILGDWGTGDAVAKNLLQQVATFKPTHLLHLGDIYFAGTQNEANTNFLALCRSVLGDIPLYSLCGNHDMYSGGQGYYWLLDQIGQKSSYFSLQNDHWLLQCMDTGFHDNNPITVNSNLTSLYQDAAWDEAAWHRAQIQNAGNRRVAVFSHHQLFSPFNSVGNDPTGNPSAVNTNLLANFQDLLPKIDIWFWGHEHTLALYDPYLGCERGRCVGASAVPVFTNQQSYTPATNLGPNLPTWSPASNLASKDGQYNNAFAIMTLNNAAPATVDYYQVPPASPYTAIQFTDTI